MRPRIRRYLAAVAVLLIVSPLRPAFAQHGAGTDQRRDQTTSVQGGNSQSGDVMKMIQAYRDENDRAARTVDEALRFIENAKGTRDPGKLRAALEKAESSLRDMRSHMKGFESVMERLSGSQRGGTREQREGMMMPPDSVQR